MGEGPKDVRKDAAFDPRTRGEQITGRGSDDLTGRSIPADRDVPGPSSTAGYAAGASLPDVRPAGESAESGDTAAIRSEIEQTRANISDTVDAIQQKLSPSNMMSEAKEATRERVRKVANAAGETANQVADASRRIGNQVADTSRRVGAQVADKGRRVGNQAAYTVRENPWATVAAVAGVGAVAWWLMSRRGEDYDEEYDDILDEYSEETLYDADLEFEDERSGWRRAARGSSVPIVIAGAGLGYWLWSRQGRDRGIETTSGVADTGTWNGTAGYGADAGSYRSFGDESGETWRDEAAQAGSRVKDAASNAADRARDAVSNAADRARGAMSNAAGKARHAMDNMGARTRSAANRASEQAAYAGRRARTQLEYWMDRNPLAVGAAALAVGAAVGMALPVTRRERRVMGDARDRLVSQAKDAASQVVDRAKQKVQQVAEQASEAMSEASKSGDSSNERPM